MGRHEKTVLDSSGKDRRESGYYSTPAFVGQFLAGEVCRIKPPCASVFDPCVGRGELLTEFLGSANINLAGMDIEEYGVSERIAFEKLDFLRWFSSRQVGTLFGAPALQYDAFVANPPYNCHEVEYIRANKNWLSSTFPTIGTDNTYSMFIAALIDLAKPGAVIAVITLDSFLTGRAHTALRRKILTECALHLIALAPQALFRDQGADVRTCILILQKGKEFQAQVQTLDRVCTTGDFEWCLANRHFVERSLSEIVLGDESQGAEIVVGLPPSCRGLFSGQRLGDEFHCITGISTGDDGKYLSTTQATGASVPFYKNPASRRFYTDPDGFLAQNYMQIAADVPNFIVRNKSFMGREGVACSSMGVRFGACHLPPGAVFGVNPNIFSKNGSDIWWLLAYLNSSLVTVLVRKAIIRTNMITSGYASKIPLVPLGVAERRRLAEIAKLATATRRGTDHEAAIKEIDAIAFAAAQVPQDEQSEITRFCADLVRLV